MRTKLIAAVYYAQRQCLFKELLRSRVITNLEMSFRQSAKTSHQKAPVLLGRQHHVPRRLSLLRRVILLLQLA